MRLDRSLCCQKKRKETLGVKVLQEMRMQGESWKRGIYAWWYLSQTLYWKRDYTHGSDPGGKYWSHACGRENMIIQRKSIFHICILVDQRSNAAGNRSAVTRNPCTGSCCREYEEKYRKFQKIFSRNLEERLHRKR